MYVLCCARSKQHMGTTACMVCLSRAADIALWLASRTLFTNTGKLTTKDYDMTQEPDCEDTAWHSRGSAWLSEDGME